MGRVVKDRFGAVRAGRDARLLSFTAEKGMARERRTTSVRAEYGGGSGKRHLGAEAHAFSGRTDSSSPRLPPEN